METIGRVGAENLLGGSEKSGRPRMQEVQDVGESA